MNFTYYHDNIYSCLSLYSVFNTTFFETSAVKNVVHNIFLMQLCLSYDDNKSNMAFSNISKQFEYSRLLNNSHTLRKRQSQAN